MEQYIHGERKLQQRTYAGSRTTQAKQNRCINVYMLVFSVRVHVDVSVPLCMDISFACLFVVCCSLSGSMGRLGHGNDVDVTRPLLVSGLSGHVVVSICASAHNTGVVTDKHGAYVWGAAAICGSDQTPSFKPMQIATQLTKQNIIITQLEMGTNHAVAITQGMSIKQIACWVNSLSYHVISCDCFPL